MYKDFTLIELMVVVAIIAVLVRVAMPSFQGKLVRDQNGNRTNEMLKDKKMSLRPAVMPLAAQPQRLR